MYIGQIYYIITWYPLDLFARGCTTLMVRGFTYLLVITDDREAEEAHFTGILWFLPEFHELWRNLVIFEEILKITKFPQKITKFRQNSWNFGKNSKTLVKWASRASLDEPKINL